MIKGMKILKIMNNNVMIASDSQGRECVVIGKGIAFHKKTGQTITLDGTEKIFKTAKKGVAEKLSCIVEDIPFEYIKVCDEVINMIRNRWKKIDEKIYLTLIDHIAFAIQRYQEGEEFPDAFIEVKSLYPDEYAAGSEAVKIIDRRMDVNLPEGEATFIALHILNANGTAATDVRQGLRLIQETLKIIQDYFHIEINEQSIAYARFIRHLKFFSSRILDREERNEVMLEENSLLKRLYNEESEEKKCAEKIAEYVELTYKRSISDNEISYLILHINSILHTKTE